MGAQIAGTTSCHRWAPAAQLPEMTAPDNAGWSAAITLCRIRRPTLYPTELIAQSLISLGFTTSPAAPEAGWIRRAAGGVKVRSQPAPAKDAKDDASFSSLRSADPLASR